MENSRESILEFIFQMAAFILGWLIAYHVGLLSPSRVRARSLGEPLLKSESKGRAGKAHQLDDAQVEDVLIECAREVDLLSFWRHWRSLPSGFRLSEQTCRALGCALLQVSPAAADVDGALEISFASGNEALAHIALNLDWCFRSGAWLWQQRNSLQAANMRIPGWYLSNMVQVFAREGRPDLVIQTWREHRSDDVLRPESELDLHADVIEGLVSCGSLGPCSQLERSELLRCPSTARGRAAFRRLMRWMARHESIESAMACLSQLRSAGADADQPSYRALIKGNVRAGAMEQAEDLYASMLSGGYMPDFGVFSSFIRGYCTRQDLQSALNHFEGGRQYGLFPDLKLYISLLELCAAAKSLESAKRVLEDMEAAGIRPSAEARSAFVRLHIAQGDLDKAFEIFQEIPRLCRDKPDVRTYHALIVASMEADRFDRLAGILASVIDGDCCIDSRACELLIMACIRRGRLTGAVKLIEAAVCKLQPAIGIDRRFPEHGQQSSRSSQLLLDPRILEELLQLIGRRGQARDLGYPLLKMLVDHSANVSATIVQRMCRAAAAEETTGVSSATSLHARRHQERRLWCARFGAG